jgi:GT2 family glycosyltransferase/glycosyltransferase involved in cell wall biosynthesis
MTAHSAQPLVSVLCRSMNRPELGEALSSIGRQTYNNIEVILVDASGKGLDRHQQLNLRFPVRLVADSQPLNRPAAANLALRNANGEYLIFLDEDDWMGVEHISQLVEALQAHQNIGVAYSSTQKTLPSGVNADETFRIPFDKGRLRRDNFIPIHSALFRKTLVNNGACFDENLDIFEDWDFWLQLSTQTDFLHIDVLTAFYRMGGQSNTASDDPLTRYLTGHPIARGRERVFDKWLRVWNGHELNETLASLDQTNEVQLLQHDIFRLNTEKAETDAQISRLNNDINTMTQTLHALNRHTKELQETQLQLEQLSRHVDVIQNSFSWKATRPIRWLHRAVHKLFVGKTAETDVAQHLSGENPAAGTRGTIFRHLDSPGPAQNEFVENICIQGWCFAHSGLDRIEALINGQIESVFSSDIVRPDVAEAFPSEPNALKSGFNHQLDLSALPAGEHTLELRFFDSTGQRVSTTQNFFLLKSSDFYNIWYQRNLPDQNEIALLQSHCSDSCSTSSPEFYLLISTNGNEQGLACTARSLADQIWQKWSIHIAGPSVSGIEDLLNANSTDKHAVFWHESLEHALESLPKEDRWIVLLQAGETLALHALSEFSRIAEQPEVQLIYSDHDVTAPSGAHITPTFTPQWSPEHLLSSNYIGGMYAIRSAHLQGWQDLQLANTAWRYALLLMAAESIPGTASSIRRVPEVLWSKSSRSSVSSNPADETEVVRAHLARAHPAATVLQRESGLRAVLWPLTQMPKVSIIIPTTGKPALIKPCIGSILRKTDYPNFEIVILDNSRGESPEGIQYLHDLGLNVVECNLSFNWARLNNIGVRHATGELYLFLNDDIEITSADWLEQLVRQAVRPQTGAVGALLYYPDGALQHAGVLLVDYGGGCVHLFHKQMPSENIYRKLHETTREVSAVTGACLMLSRNKFEEAGGFDEELAVVGNDIDLCLRLTEKGYRNIWTPLCSLTHHESISRKSSVPEEDNSTMWRRWGKRFVSGDPYYNPNLSVDKADFTLRVNSTRASNPPDTVSTATTRHEPMPAGVNLIGYIRAEMGIGEGARSDARALDAANEPFGIISFTSGNPSRMTDLSWQHRETDQAVYDITLLHINPDHAMEALAELPSSYFDGRYLIGYWAWELPEIPAEWEDAFSYFDEIWVPSGFVQDAVAMKSPIPVVRIPHAISVKTDDSLTRASFGLPEDAFLFLIMFDTHSTQERKNPFGAIESFKNAFAQDDMTVRLVIKINNATPDALQALRACVGTYQNIIFLDQVYSRKAVNSIIANCDCYVSLHRSEGFGLGPAEAMALGKSVIATNWSGNTDYMRPDNCMAINYQLLSITSDHGPYKIGQIWAEPDLQHASAAMAKLADDREFANSLGKNARKTIATEFSPEAVGLMMRKRLAAIRNLRMHNR